MLSTNANFDAKHEAVNRNLVPMYLVHFDGETVDYVNHAPASPTNTPAQYLMRISGISQKVEPEEGRASISGLSIEILDYGDAITSLLATDTAFFHRKKTTIKAGYCGMGESDMLTVFTGWVTGLKLAGNGLSYVFDVTDPQKFMQRKVFRSATDATPAVVQGNPMNIILAVLTSTGAGTNGDYDWLDEANGLGMDPDFINVAHIEEIRDTWFPGDCAYMRFSYTDRVKAKDFIEAEILKTLNCYPMIDGQGRFDIKAFKPPLEALETVQSFNEDNIVGLPDWDANLDALVNEVEAYYDHDGDDYTSQAFYVQSTSLNLRGPGKKPVTIKSKGLHTSITGSSVPDRASDQMERRKNKIFGRFSVPPISIKFKTHFSRWLSEAGDIVPFTHLLIPDLEAGTRGLSEARMEIISRNVDWSRGQVAFELLNTGFARDHYMVICPVMTVVSATSGTAFVVSTADAAKFRTGWEVQVTDAAGRQKAASITILTIDTATGAITCDNIGSTPAAGWKIKFADYGTLTDEQKLWWLIRASGSNLIVP